MLSRVFTLVLLFAVQLCFQFGQATRDTHPDFDLTTPALAKKYGYPLEIHKAVTKDGYILEMHRIPYGKNAGSTRQSRSPVLLQHGLAGSSADWIFMGPGRALGYFLADAGFDVWMGNNRGNVYSRNHTTMLPSDKDFWDFSFHELGLYDMTAMIDLILQQTESKRVLYVGHSQGTTQFLVMTSLRPEYNSKISLMVGLAPAAFTGNLRGPITKLTGLTYFGVWVGENFGYPELGSRSSWGKFVTNLLCSSHVPTQLFCTNGLFLVAGFSRNELNRDNITVIIGHVPAGASWKQAIHYGQGYLNPGHFRMFDYGDPKKNFRLYDSPVPPEYALERVQAPVALFSSPEDWLAPPEDVELLTDRLRSVVYHQKLEDYNFNHYDFIWGKYSKQLVFLPLLRLLQDYSHNRF